MFWLPVLLALAQGAPFPGMQCEPRTLILYDLGPNWSNAQQHVKAHLAYGLERMRSGEMIFGGPELGAPPQAGEPAAAPKPAGAVAVYRSPKWEEVEAIVSKDPFVAEGVLKVRSHTAFMACSAAP